MGRDQVAEGAHFREKAKKNMIIYVSGDATKPDQPGVNVLCHICNNHGVWGKGFVLAVDKISKEPREYYLKQSKYSKNFKLGQVQWTFINPHFAVVNMVAQMGLRSAQRPKPLDERALYHCLRKVDAGCSALKCSDEDITIHMPKIGSGLGGGDWNFIECVVDCALPSRRVFVYTLDQ